MKHKFPHTLSNILIGDEDAKNYDIIGELLWDWWIKDVDIIVLENNDVVINKKYTGDIIEIKKNKKFKKAKYVIEKTSSSDTFFNLLEYSICKLDKKILNKLLNQKNSENAWKIICEYCINIEYAVCSLKRYECKRLDTKLNKYYNK
jgi:hypothetical protein